MVVKERPLIGGCEKHPQLTAWRRSGPADDSSSDVPEIVFGEVQGGLASFQQCGADRCC